MQKVHDQLQPAHLANPRDLEYLERKPYLLTSLRYDDRLGPAIPEGQSEGDY